jgi:hypothetical protein
MQQKAGTIFLKQIAVLIMLEPPLFLLVVFLFYPLTPGKRSPGEGRMIGMTITIIAPWCLCGK